MIGKNEQTNVKNVDNSRVKIITDKRKILEDNSTKVRNEIKNCFEELIKSLKTREKQLLRQLEAVHTQQLSIVQSNSELLPSVPSVNVNLDDWQTLDDTIMKFGKLELPNQDGIVVKNTEPYKVEEYEDANKDHVSFDKSIKIDDDNNIIINIPSPSIGKKINLYKNNNMELPSCSNNDNLNVSSETEIHLQLNTESNNIIGVFGDHDYLPLCSSNDSQVANNINNLSTSSVNGLSTQTKNSTTNIQQNNENSIQQDADNDHDVDLKKINVNDDCKKQDNDEHPKQIQQWLEQILVETETEPAIHEIQQFADISKSRYKEFEFPLKI
ncbi:hypothetical protein HCN44_005077 [Aphidius gifuensis]|uniref:Uncharacterized protein n=1 Tax=Aphidius gifuensis TaxID=684658 RepID=A0A835CSY4_APHGI|nr:homeobox protein 3-like [Aphidius gifuensis]KAF7992733.1 hypothetical protein HCN44_005077 [Aphidius gifuensis]